MVFFLLSVLSNEPGTDLIWGVRTVRVYLAPVNSVRWAGKVPLSSGIWDDGRYNLNIKSLGNIIIIIIIIIIFI
jgi:hypothetical protein